MKVNKFVSSIFVGAMLMSSVNVMANEVPVAVVAKASQMKKASVEALLDDTRVFNVDKSIEVLKVMF
jgi:hypothetical protein